MRLKINAAVQTHVGNVRANNEDNYYLCGNIRTDVTQIAARYRCDSDDRLFLAAVADGMGGEEFGELASLTAVQNLSPCDFEQVRYTALSCIRQANLQICAQMKEKNSSHMGSTIVALYIDGGRAICCNMGDSRCYLFRKNILTKLSVDHNKAERMVELGVLTPEQAKGHASRHELTRHLGVNEEEIVIEPAFSEVINMWPEDVFLLCSDGLTDMVTEEEIAERLRSGGTPEEQVEDLIQTALMHGGRDNVTALVVRLEGDKRSVLQRLFLRNE